jgi:hypothetical protein
MAVEPGASWANAPVVTAERERAPASARRQVHEDLRRLQTGRSSTSIRSLHISLSILDARVTPPPQPLYDELPHRGEKFRPVTPAVCRTTPRSLSVSAAQESRLATKKVVTNRTAGALNDWGWCMPCTIVQKHGVQQKMPQRVFSPIHLLECTVHSAYTFLPESVNMEECLCVRSLALSLSPLP